MDWSHNSWRTLAKDQGHWFLGFQTYPNCIQFCKSVVHLFSHIFSTWRMIPPTVDQMSQLPSISPDSAPWGRGEEWKIVQYLPRLWNPVLTWDLRSLRKCCLFRVWHKSRLPSFFLINWGHFEILRRVFFFKLLDAASNPPIPQIRDTLWQPPPCE